MAEIGKWDLDEKIGDWTAGQLLEFIQGFVGEGPVHLPRLGAGVSLKEYMKSVPRWQDNRSAEEIIRDIYESRTIGRDITLDVPDSTES